MLPITIVKIAINYKRNKKENVNNVTLSIKMPPMNIITASTNAQKIPSNIKVKEY